MKIKIGRGQLYLAFTKARRALESQSTSFNENIKLFENSYGIEFIEGISGLLADDQLVFKSEEKYFAFLMRWS